MSIFPCSINLDIKKPSMNTALQRIEDIRRDKIFYPALKKPEELDLEGIKAVKIYFCFYGRNSWNSAWVHKYKTNCMHLTLDSAKNYAETNRVQGSVFNITELPALQFDGGNYPIFVTQINEKIPLKDYSADALSQYDPYGRLKISGYMDNYMTYGAPLNGIVSSFTDTGRFLRTPQAKNNLVIALYAQNPVQATELENVKMKAWKSKSAGKKFYLNWLAIENNTNQLAILNL